MKIGDLEKVKGTLQVLTYLYKNGGQRPRDLIKGVKSSSDTIYKVFKKFDGDLLEMFHDKDRRCLLWVLTDKGKCIAEDLINIEENL